jgi:hypothetical protein
MSRFSLLYSAQAQDSTLGGLNSRLCWQQRELRLGHLAV